MTRCVQGVLVLCLFCVSLLGSLALEHPVVLAQTVQSPGGFLEKAGMTYRARWSNEKLRSFLPNGRGKFTFPAPYQTEAVRLTDSSDCGAVDCLWYVGYSYWRNTNNHVGSDEMLIFLSFNKGLGGAGPTLFSFNKSTDTVKKVGPLFPDYSPYTWKTGAGWYFSATLPTILYMDDGPRMLRYDVFKKEFQTIFDVTAQFGTDRHILQMHSSNDDTVHSATLRRTSTGEDLGCLVYRETAKQFLFYQKVGTYDECHIDKSGGTLLILEFIGSQSGLANRYINLGTGVETRVLNAAGTGALGHHDMGFGYIVGADGWNQLPNATSVNQFSPSFTKGPVGVNKNYNWDLVQAMHVTHSNAKPGTPVDQQYACGSYADRTSYAQNEIVCFRLNNSMDQLVVAPIMTDLNAAGGRDDYSKVPKGNLDITGQYFIWTSNVGTGRQEAFIVKVPSTVLFGAPPYLPAVAQTPSTGLRFQASTDFSGVQGPRWFYQDSVGRSMTFNSAQSRWQGAEQYLSLWRDGGHPGNAADAVRRWVAPSTGTINIAGKVSDLHAACGRGAMVFIRKGSTVLLQRAFANGETGLAFNVATSVMTGEAIDFVINRGADDWGCDSTGFDPVITYVSP